MNKYFWEVPIEIKGMSIKPPNLRREQWYEILANALIVFVLFLVRRE